MHRQRLERWRACLKLSGSCPHLALFMLAAAICLWPIVKEQVGFILLVCQEKESSQFITII